MCRNKEELQALNQIGESIANAFTFGIGVPFFAQILLKGILSKLWLWINMMQLYSALTVLPIYVPFNVLMIQSFY